MIKLLLVWATTWLFNSLLSSLLVQVWAITWFVSLYCQSYYLTVDSNYYSVLHTSTLSYSIWAITWLDCLCRATTCQVLFSLYNIPFTFETNTLNLLYYLIHSYIVPHLLVTSLSFILCVYLVNIVLLLSLTLSLFWFCVCFEDCIATLFTKHSLNLILVKLNLWPCLSVD